MYREYFSFEMLDSMDESTTAYLENVIRDLEMADDDQMSSSLRTIFLHYDVKEFLERLNDRLKYHDSQIAQVCQYHHQRSMESFEKLLDTRADEVALKDRSDTLSDKFKGALNEIMNKTSDLISAHKQIDNIEETIEALQSSMPVFEAYRRLKQRMKAKDYYPAIKMIEELHTTLLPIVDRYKWSKCVLIQLKRFRESIAKESLNELKNFLEHVSTKSEIIGKAVFIRFFNSLESPTHNVLVDIRQLLDIDNHQMHQPPANPFDELIDLSSEALNISDLIDVLPVHRCININTVLGTVKILSGHYKAEKQKQLNVVMDTGASSALFYPDFRRLILRTVGFFVVEEHILCTTKGFIDNRFISELTSVSLTRLSTLFRNTIKSCRTPSEMLTVKFTLFIFSETMKDYFYPVGKVLQLLREHRTIYFDLLLKIWALKFKKLFDQDNYALITVQNDEQFMKLVQKYKYFDFVDTCFNVNGHINKHFPVTMNFSVLLPELYCSICDFALECFKYYDGLYDETISANEILREPLNILLSEKLHQCLSNILNDDKNRTLTQLIQICINASQLEMYIGDRLEHALSEIIRSKKCIRLKCADVFKRFRDDAQKKIYSQLNHSINQFLELAMYDWTRSESNGFASAYLIDLLNFLRTTFNSFSGMSNESIENALMGACAQISEFIMSKLLDPEIRSISYASLEQLELDLIQCEQFVDEMSHLDGIHENIFENFAELRQLLDLVISKSWSSYFVDAGAEKVKFSKVDAKKALIIVEKDGLKRKGILSGLRSKQIEKDEKRVLSTVAEELEMLILNDESD